MPVLPARLEHSDARFQLERQADTLSIRLPFSAVQGVGEAAARGIVLERSRQPFAGLEDFVTRTRLPMDTLRQLVQAGVLETFGSRREILRGTHLTHMTCYTDHNTQVL